MLYGVIDMFEIIGLAINEVFFYVKQLIYYFTYPNTPWMWFYPVIFIGIGISVVFLVFKIIKSVIWGR